jgi:O-antigen/teichoic acid export membrane protein
MSAERVAAAPRITRERRQVATRAAASVFGQVSNRASNALLTIIVADAISVSDFGIFSVIQAVMILTTALGAFGFDVLILRDPSSVGSPHPDRAYYSAKVRLGLIAGLLLSLYTLVTIGSRAFPLAILASIAAVMAALAETPETRLAVANRYGTRALVQAVPTLVVTIFAVAVIRASSLPSTVTLWLACIFLIIREATRFATGYAVRRRTLPAPAPVHVSVTTLVRRSAAFASVGILTYVYFRIDALILGSIAGTKALASYNAEYNLLLGGPAISAALGTLWLRMLLKEPNAWRKLMPANLMLGILLAAFFILSASPLTNIVYGDRYAHAAGLLRVLALVLPLSFCDSILLRMIYVRDRQKLVTPIIIVATLVNVGLNFAFIPIYGAMAAAWITVVTEAVLLTGFAGVCWFTRKLDYTSPLRSNPVR